MRLQSDVLNVLFQDQMLLPWSVQRKRNLTAILRKCKCIRYGEVVCWQVRDLLRPDSDFLDIREDPVKGMCVAGEVFQGCTSPFGCQTGEHLRNQGCWLPLEITCTVYFIISFAASIVPCCCSPIRLFEVKYCMSLVCSVLKEVIKEMSLHTLHACHLQQVSEVHHNTSCCPVSSWSYVD